MSSDPKSIVNRISYLVMGQAELFFSTKTQNPYFALRVLAQHTDMLDYALSIIQEITAAEIKPGNNGEEENLRLISRPHPFFSRIRQRIYVGSYKSLDYHVLRSIDEEFLAVMYMFYGSLTKKGRVRLDLNKLSFGDLNYLKRAIKVRLGYVFNVVPTPKRFGLELVEGKEAEFFAAIDSMVLPSYRNKLLGRLAPDETQGDDIV